MRLLPNRLDRYFFQEMLVPFCIGTFAVLFMFQANELIAILKNFNPQNVPPLAVLQLIVLKSPYFLSQTLPVGTSLGASLAMSRLVRESELTAIRAAGVPIVRSILPVAFFGILVGLLNYWVVERVTPGAELASRRLLSETTLLNIAPDFRPNVSISLRNGVAYIGSVARQPDGSVALTDLLLFEKPRSGETWIWQCDRGTYRDGVFLLDDTRFFQVSGDDVVIAKSGQRVEINEKIIVQDLFMPPLANEQTQDQLFQAIQEGKRQKRDTRSLEVEYHTRFSVPASCFVFALTSPVFAIWLARRGGLVGVLLSIVSVGLYYNAFVISTEIFGSNGWVPPIVAAWLPNVLFFVLGLIGLRRME